MKTTENISIGGLAFTIESDAYIELDGYLNEIAACFSNDPSGNEIVEDIEVRISELIKEKCPDGAIVSLETVREIKKRIGDPKELSEEETISAEETPISESAEHSHKCSFRERRLYRDIDNRMIAGVCSGLGEYLNLDKVIFRVLFLVLFVLGFIEADSGMFVISVIAYTILWIAVPAARTVEEKCEMRSKPINLEGFKSKENRFEKEVKEAVNSPAGKTFARILMSCMGIILLVLGIGGLFSMIFVPTIHQIVETSMIAELSPFDAEELLAINIIRNDVFWWMSIGCMGLACIGMLYGGIMLTFDFKRPAWKPGLIIFVLWVISLLALAAWLLSKVADWLPTIL